MEKTNDLFQLERLCKAIDEGDKSDEPERCHLDQGALLTTPAAANAMQSGGGSPELGI
ncbi:hypothetical protein [Mesorhizobium shangrilense]|uniref:Uncharacterized protein n=1 Tax=Mesorhizobium shangrilense TaxID=460060 RepID=A0ABV2DLI7_9HYPH